MTRRDALLAAAAHAVFKLPQVADAPRRGTPAVEGAALNFAKTLQLVIAVCSERTGPGVWDGWRELRWIHSAPLWHTTRPEPASARAGNPFGEWIRPRDPVEKGRYGALIFTCEWNGRPDRLPAPDGSITWPVACIVAALACGPHHQVQHRFPPQPMMAGVVGERPAADLPRFVAPHVTVALEVLAKPRHAELRALVECGGRP